MLHRKGMATFRPFGRRDKVLKSGTGQSSPARSIRLATSPVVWRKGSPNSGFSVRQARVAASVKVTGRPRLPLGSASQTVSGSNQPYGDCRQSPTGQWISSDPRCFRAAL